MSKHYIEDENLSKAWVRALKAATPKGKKEIVPLVVSITGFDDGGNFIEDDNIRTLTDSHLSSAGLQSIETVAGTIFPYSLWNPKASRAQLFDRYSRMLPKLKKHHLNNQGIYFERMISGGSEENPNQLEFLLNQYLSRDAVRRSMLQVGIFNPAKDHSAAAQKGFPCLQHVTFAPSGDELSVNAFYASQFLVERAYGNYVGICRLGQFVAHELGLKLSRVTFFSGIAKCEGSKRELEKILNTVSE